MVPRSEAEAFAEGRDRLRHRHVADDAAGRELRLELPGREPEADVVDVVQAGAGHVDDPRGGNPGHRRRHPAEDQHQGIEDETGIDSASDEGNPVRDGAFVERTRDFRKAQSGVKHPLRGGDDVESRFHRLLELGLDRRHMGLGHVEDDVRRLLERCETARQVRVDRYVGRAGAGKGSGKGPARQTRVVVDGARDLEIVDPGPERLDHAAAEGAEAPQDDSCSFRIGHAVLLVKVESAGPGRHQSP